jgi:alkaline phosphatase D
MAKISRRKFLKSAAGLGAAAAWGGSLAFASTVLWKERRDLFPEGVASGDPDSHSVLLWTRRAPIDDAFIDKLHVEVAEDEKFERVVASADAPIGKDADWTCRVLVGGLKPAHVYWYRFTDKLGEGSRVGRTITAPEESDARPVKFVFVSCQNANQGAQNAYRRMIFEDKQAAPAEQIGFILHLGDFIYELVWYPEDRPQGMYDRKIYDVVRYPDGEKHSDFHIPTNVEGYRAVYRGYLKDPDLQDARARWPFVNMWDNHEFSWLGWQSLQIFEGKTRPAQTRKVAAMQAFFEYQPARMSRPNSSSLERFEPPRVVDTPVTSFDDHGLGTEPNNLTALHSLKGYRALRYGKNMELIVTDQRTFRSEDPTGMDEAKAFSSDDFPDMMPQEAMEILDAGRTWNGGRAPATIRYGGTEVSNYFKDRPAQTILGAEQKAWFLEKLRASKATWKIWGNTTATLDMRADPQNLPAGLGKPWPGASYAGFGGGDHSTAYVERAEIYDFVRDHGITGFATVAGDRHSFWAGYAAKALPPAKFEPVGIAFVTGSISAPGMVEAFEHRFPKQHPLRPLFLGQASGDANPQPTVNMMLKHGVKSCLEYVKTGDVTSARAVSNPENAPHVSFVDMGGHGYSVVRVTNDAIETEFVCIPRPLERSATDNGGPIRYRAQFRTAMWKRGGAPRIEAKVIEGEHEARFSI